MKKFSFIVLIWKRRAPVVRWTDDVYINCTLFHNPVALSNFGILFYHRMNVASNCSTHYYDLVVSFGKTNDGHSICQGTHGLSGGDLCFRSAFGHSPWSPLLWYLLLYTEFLSSTQRRELFLNSFYRLKIWPGCVSSVWGLRRFDLILYLLIFYLLFYWFINYNTITDYILIMYQLSTD